MAEEREQDKRCWKCKFTDKEYGCWCDLTGASVILDMTVEDTLNCENFEEKATEDEYNDYISELDEKKQEEIETGERLE